MYIDSLRKDKKDMKVFISWSGERSKKVALIFHEWLPQVIQSLEPFVSSEDIEKGSRWNTDIAQELKESTFGLICVTKDNLSAPWLNFEAGALSKTIENNYVAPLLFDVKPSELKGSPISQFQATSFNKDDMKRLVETLNMATGNSLSSSRLDKAFELCYPDLETKLNELKAMTIEEEADEVSKTVNQNLDPNILEELLETVRNTQRLLGNTDSKLYSNIEQVNKKTDEIMAMHEKQLDIEMRRNSRRLSPMYVKELMYGFHSTEEMEEIFPYNLLIMLSVFKEDFPWLYEAGSELVRTIESRTTVEKKRQSVNKFRNILEMTCEHPFTRDLLRGRKDMLMLLRDFSMMITSDIERYIDRTLMEK